LESFNFCNRIQTVEYEKSNIYVPISKFTQRNSELNSEVLIFHRLWFLKLILSEDFFFSACRQFIVCYVPRCCRSV